MNWQDHFEGLAQLDPVLLDALAASSEVVSIKKNSVIVDTGKATDQIVLLLEGCIQVQKISENGREIVLYRINDGDSCILTAACVLAYEDFFAKAIAETDIKVVLIPRDVFDELMGASREFRQFVLAAFSKRLTDLFQVVEELAFKRIDHRLAQKLLDLSPDGAVIKATHQNLASELGSVREVVSRQMGDFQNRGWIQQSRGMIEIINRLELERSIEA